MGTWTAICTECEKALFGVVNYEKVQKELGDKVEEWIIECPHCEKEAKIRFERI
jgi:hypothetical protein